MLTVEEFVEKFIDEDGEVSLPRTCYIQEENIVDSKLLLCIEVWKKDEQFFEVTYAQDNSGYWDDGESYPPIVAEVFPEEVTITKYVKRTKDAN